MKALEARGITKIFPGVVALDSVDISFELGKIHAVIGENGAGKSTLIKCLTGIKEPTSGEILIDGKSALADKKLFDKIAYVPQEIDLFDSMTVAENLFIPFEKTGFSGPVNQSDLQKKALPYLEKFHIVAPPDALVSKISVSEQQLLQIARAAVHKDYEVLMLDEPTTSLTTNDTKRLFEVIKQIKEENKAIVFISHKLEEVFEICDEVTIFRNGKKVADAKIDEIDIPTIIKKMTGREMNREQTYFSDKVSDDVLLEVDHLTGERFTDVSFNLKKGEILGFSGLVGAGRSEIMQAVFGYLPVYSGKVKLEGNNWKLGDTHYSVEHGLIYLPEERKRQGILPVLSVKENVSISFLKSLKSGISISDKKERAATQEIIDTYEIKVPNMDSQIQYLSGGNQQKAIIGRSMFGNPKVLIFDEPTKGIDVGAKAEIYRLMKKLAEENGIGIILISSEMEEVMKCSNRILTFYEGKKTGEFEAGTSKNALLSSIIGVKPE